MNFKQFIEEKTPHVNDMGYRFASKHNLARGRSTAMNQLDNNCYEIAKDMASNFGYELPSYEEIANTWWKFKKYWSEKRMNPNARPPILPKPGIANAILRDGPEMVGHVSFEYKNKEYNYGPASKQEFEIIFRLPCKKIQSF